MIILIFYLLLICRTVLRRKMIDDPNRVKLYLVPTEQWGDPAGLVQRAKDWWFNFYSQPEQLGTPQALGWLKSVSLSFVRIQNLKLIMEMGDKMRENVVETKNCFSKLSFYSHKIPETCRWLIEKVIVLSKTYQGVSKQIK